MKNSHWSKKEGASAPPTSLRHHAFSLPPTPLPSVHEQAFSAPSAPSSSSSPNLSDSESASARARPEILLPFLLNLKSTIANENAVVRDPSPFRCSIVPLPPPAAGRQASAAQSALCTQSGRFSSRPEIIWRGAVCLRLFVAAV